MEKAFYLGSSPYFTDESNLLFDIEEEQVPSVYNDLKKVLEQDGWNCTICHRKRGFFYDDDESPLKSYSKYKERGEHDKKAVELTFVMDFEKDGKSVSIASGSRFDDAYNFEGYMFTPFDEKFDDLDVRDYCTIVKTNDKKLLDEISNIVDKYTIQCDNQENFDILTKGVSNMMQNYLRQYKSVKKVIDLTPDERVSENMQRR